MECIITYQKSNGEIFIRTYDYTIKKIGQETSMGWKVLNIHYKFGDNYYVEQDYDRISRQKRQPLRKRIVNKIIDMLYKYR